MPQCSIEAIHFFYFFTACEVAIGNYQTIRDNKYFYKSEQFLLKFYNRFSFWLKKVMMGIKNPLSTGGTRGLSVIIYVYSMCTVYNVYLRVYMYLIQYSDKNMITACYPNLFCVLLHYYSITKRKTIEVVP